MKILHKIRVFDRLLHLHQRNILYRDLKPENNNLSYKSGPDKHSNFMQNNLLCSKFNAISNKFLWPRFILQLVKLAPRQERALQDHGQQAAKQIRARKLIQMYIDFTIYALESDNFTEN